MSKTHNLNRAVPSSNRSQRPAGSATAGVSFLNDLRIEHGPLSVLGRFFLKADEAAKARGVTLAFASLEDLRAANEHVQDPWWDLMPMFDPGVHTFEPDRSLCLLGYNANGEVVASQAARVYDLRQTNLKRAAGDLSLFYGSAKPPQTAFCQITAPSAEKITGLVTYEGCAWYRRDYRGRLLSMIGPRIARALGLALWNAEFSVGFVDWILVKKGVTERYGYRHADDGVLMRGILEVDFDLAVVSMHRDQLLADLRAFLSGSLSEIDVAISRGGHQKRLAQPVSER